MQQKYIDAYAEYKNNPFVQIKDLELKYGFSKSSFYRALKKENISLPKKEYVTTCSKSDLDKALALYNQGHSINQISKELKMGERTISRYLKSLNIDIKNKSEKRNDLTVNSEFFSVIQTEEQAYWLGFIYADGCVTTNKTYRLAVELNSIDEDHLLKLRESLQSNHDIKRRKDRNMSSISINSKNLVNGLCQIGCIQNKTYEGFIDKSKIPKSMYKHFLRGYMDGDGFIDKNRYRTTYTIKLRSVAEILQEMLKELHIDMKLQEVRGYHVLSIENKADYFNLLSVLYDNANIYLERKMQTYQDRIKAKPF